MGSTVFSTNKEELICLFHNKLIPTELAGDQEILSQLRPEPERPGCFDLTFVYLPTATLIWVYLGSTARDA